MPQNGETVARALSYWWVISLELVTGGLFPWDGVCAGAPLSSSWARSVWLRQH